MVKTEHKIQSESSKSIPSSSSSSSTTTTTTTSSSSSCRKKKYKGVRMRSWGSWVSEIRAPNQKTRIWLGSYSTAEAAARAYDAALLCLKGSSANLNFPITSSHHHLPHDTIMSPKSIQRVAAAAANSYLDNATTPPSPPLPSSSSPISSPSRSSSPSDHIDDDHVSLIPSFGTYTTYGADEPMSMIAPWYDFDSPKYIDQLMLNGASFDPPMIEDFYDEGDIRLWSFC